MLFPLHQIFLVTLGFSWLAFAFARFNNELIYLPLKSFFIPISTDLGQVAAWFLASKLIKVPLGYKVFSEILIWLLLALLVFYFLKTLFVLIKNQSYSFEQVKNSSTLLALIACFLLPSDSSDLFGYIARGFQQVGFGQNPFAEVVAEIPQWQNEPMLANLLWEHNPSPYGPAFMLITKVICSISGSNLWLAMLLFKALNLICFYFCLDLVQKLISKENFISDKRLSLSIFAVLALNPFVIIQVFWNAHNDLLLGFLVLFAIYQLYKQRLVWAFIFLSLSILVKYISLVLLPLFLIFAFKIKGKKLDLFFSLIISLAISLFLASHYQLFDLDYSRLAANVSLSHKSLFDVCNSLFKYIAHHDLPLWCRYIFLSAFAIYAAWLYIKAFASKNNKDIFAYSFWLIFILLFFASPKFHSWYLMMLLPLGLFVHPQLMLMLSMTHLLSLTFLDQANIANYLLMSLTPILLYFRPSLRGTSQSGLTE